MTSRRATRRDQTPRFLRRFGPYDVFAIGPAPGGALVLVQTLDDTWPAEVKNAISRRRRATLYGRCDCGARRGTTRMAPDGVLHATLSHEVDCPASDEQLGQLLARHGMAAS